MSEELFEVPELDDPDTDEADTEAYGAPVDAAEEDVKPVEDDDLEEADTDPDEET